jgi:hypothetical protein
MTAAHAARTADPEADWIVCLGEAREARDGAVACPRLDGRMTPLVECEECHLLAWRRDERDRTMTCSTPDVLRR